MADPKPVALPPHLWEVLAQMSAEMGVDPDALVAQAVFTLARLNGYLVPGKVSLAGGAPPTASSPSKVRGRPRAVEPEPEPEPEGNPFDPQPPEEDQAAAEPEAAPTRGKPGLTLFVSGRDPYRMSGEAFTIGRGKTCDFVIESNRVSREHCRIFREGNDYFLEDLNSSNGTFYGPNKEKVTRRRIKDGDEFTLGTEKIRFQVRK